MGLMLETTAEITAHRKSPGKDPKMRIRFIEEAGKLRIPFTTGLLVGVGETCEDRSLSLLEIKKLHERYSHIQEIIIQPFVPQLNTPMEKRPKPEVTELLSLVATTRLLMPEMNIQVPPNLLEDGDGARTHRLVEKFLIAGANDLGGISPLTPDFINPEHPWPKLKELYTEIKEAGFIPRERLPIYPEYIKNGFMSDKVAELVTKLAGEDGFKK
jgi:7,8-didemethyl-8-hydroxy-5-deazariboflavin synthase CofG subunit